MNAVEDEENEYKPIALVFFGSTKIIFNGIGFSAALNAQSRNFVL